MIAERLKNSLAYLSWSHIAGAVMDVFRENQAAEERGGEKASADSWGLESERRRSVWERARDHWARRAKKDTNAFPYNEDGVVRLYFRYRKRNEDELAGFAEEIEGNRLW